MVARCQSETATGEIKYTNHSLRATAASRLFVKNVPEKIIAERTGHKCLGGLRAYTGDLIPGSAGHTLLSSLSNNLFDV